MAGLVSSVAGIIGGRNPLDFSGSSPYTLFMFQSIFIIALCTLVHYPVKKLQQPKVIAEVVAGILLGPSVMGKIPGFTDLCFPSDLIPGLTLMANIGIILFLFMVGLEVDLSFIKRNIKAALSVGLINMAVPFGLGCAISVGLYNHYRVNDPDGEPIKFTTYMVFIAVAMCVTAFPVLARILTELNLITDRVGTIVLAAGITNDLVGWILLALAVILANASQAVNTVYILLLTVAWFLLVAYPVRLLLRFYLKRYTNDLQSGEPSQFLMMIILVLCFVSAFYTDIIGVHAIFGAFMIGVIVPRDNGYVIRITEKLEDLVHIIMIPIYFALAGLNVNLGLLNSGTDWGYIIGIICLAMVGKISGGFIAAKFNRLFWRESLAVGVLMSCKGIVEIVVLNVGLNSGIISSKVYSMFIVMALVTTFLTTPLTLWVYPITYREKVKRFLAGEINWDGSEIQAGVPMRSNDFNNIGVSEVSSVTIPKVTLLLKDVNGLAPLLLLAQLYLKPDEDCSLNAIHLRNFSSRTSHLLEASNPDEEHTDLSTSVLELFKIFTKIMGLKSTYKSILATPRNQLLAVNEQILKLDLTISCSKAEQVLHTFAENDDVVELSDVTLYDQMFKKSSSNFGLLLTPKSDIERDNYVEVKSNPESEQEKSSFVVNIVISNDNYLTPADLLAIHTALRMTRKLVKVNIFIKSKGQSSGLDEELESLFSHTETNLELFHIKDSLNYTEFILRKVSTQNSNLFITGNNLSTDSEALFSTEVHELVEMANDEGFDVLVVRSNT